MVVSLVYLFRDVNYVLFVVSTFIFPCGFIRIKKSAHNAAEHSRVSR